MLCINDTVPSFPLSFISTFKDQTGATPGSVFLYGHEMDTPFTFSRCGTFRALIVKIKDFDVFDVLKVVMSLKNHGSDHPMSF